MHENNILWEVRTSKYKIYYKKNTRASTAFKYISL